MARIGTLLVQRGPAVLLSLLRGTEDELSVIV